MVDAGMEVPAIENRPSIHGLEWLWEAFLELDTCRQVGMTPGRIPWIVIQQYANELRLNNDERYMLHRVVRHLDQTMLDYHSKKQHESSKVRK